MSSGPHAFKASILLTESSSALTHYALAIFLLLSTLSLCMAFTNCVVFCCCDNYLREFCRGRRTYSDLVPVCGHLTSCSVSMSKAEHYGRRACGEKLYLHGSQESLQWLTSSSQVLFPILHSTTNSSMISSIDEARYLMIQVALQSSFTSNQALTHEPPGIFLGLKKNNYEHDFRYFKLLRIKFLNFLWKMYIYTI